MWLLRRLVPWVRIGLLLWTTWLVLGPQGARGSTSPPPVALAPSDFAAPVAPGRSATSAAKPTSAPRATPTAPPRPTARPTPATTSSPTPTQAPTPTPTPTPAPTPNPT